MEKSIFEELKLCEISLKKSTPPNLGRSRTNDKGNMVKTEEGEEWPSIEQEREEKGRTQKPSPPN